MSQQNALIQEGLDQSYLWRLWASWRNGMPEKPSRNVIGGVTATIASGEAAPQPAVQPKPSGIGTMGKLLIGTALLGGGGAAGVAAHQWLTQDEATVETDGDLLGYLRREGYHVPPAEGKP